jgi:hypothetical protein
MNSASKFLFPPVKTMNKSHDSYLNPTQNSSSAKGRGGGGKAAAGKMV